MADENFNFLNFNISQNLSLPKGIVNKPSVEQEEVKRPLFSLNVPFSLIQKKTILRIERGKTENQYNALNQ